MQKIHHKRGATFNLACQLLNPDGTPRDITGLTVTSDVLTGPDRFSLDVTVTTALIGEFVLIETDTTPWNLTDIETRTVQTFCDVRFANSEIDYTETFEIVVERRITTNV